MLSIACGNFGAQRQQGFLKQMFKQGKLGSKHAMEHLMNNLLIILALLFAALFVLVILAEKFGSRDQTQTAKLSRYIVPLVAILLLAQLIKMLFFSN